MKPSLGEKGYAPHETKKNQENTSFNEEEEPNEQKNAFLIYEEEIGQLTPMVADSLKDWEAVVPEKWVKDAIMEASANGARNWKYIEAILKRWSAQKSQEPRKKSRRTEKSSTPQPVQLSAQELERLRAQAERDMT
jgi:DnaD/phage-associated family protein